MNKKRDNKDFSLRWGLIGIVVSCWLLPLMIIIFILTYYTSNSIERQIKETIGVSVSNAAHIARNTFQLAVAASRNASYDGSVWRAYQDYKSTGNNQQVFDEINNYLVRQYRFNDGVLGAVLFFCDNTNRLYDISNPSFLAPYTHLIEYRQDVHEKAIEIAEDLDTAIAFFPLGKGLYMIRNIVDKDYVPYAVLVLKLNMENVDSAFTGITWQTGATLYLNDTEYVIDDNPLQSEKSVKPERLEFEVGTYRLTDSGAKSIIEGRENIDGVDILYSVEVDRKGMMSGFDNYVVIFYLLLALLFPLLAFVIWYFYRNIFSPITTISSAARSIQNGQLGMQIEKTAPNKEFQYLMNAFNQMSVKLKQQFERIYSEELALRDARIMALQSQINPHFLNNTLEIINWESRLGNNAKASRMIEALSTMLDAAMDRKSLPTVPLSQELMYLDEYLYIITERFGKRLTVEKEIDKNLLQFHVPRLIMQPIIENAIEHGVSTLQKGTIIIRVMKDSTNSEMLLEVENNSPLSEADMVKINELLSPEYDARSSGSLHLGIHNVNMRLKIIYGDKVGLQILSKGTGTVSSINIPLNSLKM